eukprot:1031124-Pyramimonas_sp.AAC.2
MVYGLGFRVQGLRSERRPTGMPAPLAKGDPPECPLHSGLGLRPTRVPAPLGGGGSRAAPAAAGPPPAPATTNRVRRTGICPQRRPNA